MAQAKYESTWTGNVISGPVKCQLCGCCNRDRISVFYYQKGVFTNANRWKEDLGKQLEN